MLIAIIGAIVAALSASSFINTELFPDSKKAIKQHVEEKHRRKECLYQMERYEKTIKKSKKSFTKVKEGFADMYKDQETTTAQFDSLMLIYFKKVKTQDSLYNRTLFKVKGMTTNDEWGAILVDMEKRYEDVKKAQAKRVEAKYETNDKFSEKMLKDRGLDDTVSRAVMAVFDSLNSNAMYYLKQYNTFDLQENDILRDKESSVDALDSLSFAKQELARKYVELYIDAHHKFSSLMTKKEWRVVIGFGKESFE